MLADVMNYLSFLLSLIEVRDWIKLEYIFLSNPTIFRFISKSISDCEELNGMTLLHACLRYDPPLNILGKMIELYPQALAEKDCLGRTPLHVAAGSGASPLVLKLLTMNYPQACSVQDEDGKTPLHFACDATCELFEGDDQVQASPRGPPSIDTVRVLLSGSLAAVTLEDFDEMNAVEYAIISDAPMEVVKLLQKASQRVLKMTKMNVSRPTETVRPMAVMKRIRAC